MKQVWVGLIATILSANTFAQSELGQNKFIDPANMDKTVKAGDDFFRFASGTWLKKNPVPGKETRWGSFQQLREFNINAVKKVLENARKNAANDPVANRVASFYKAAMDSAFIEMQGYQPIAADLRRIENVTDAASLTEQLSFMQRTGLGSPLFGIRVAQDRKFVNNMRVHLSQGGTTLPDRDYYLKNDARTLGIQKAFKNYVSKLFTLVGTPAEQSIQFADLIFNFEKKLAEAQFSRTEMRNPYLTYNKYAKTNIDTLSPGIDWKSMLPLLRVEMEDSVIVSNPAFFKTAGQLLQHTSLTDIKTYLKWNVLSSAADYLSKDFVDASFAYNQVITGQKVQTPRWQRMSQLADRNVGELLGQLYVKEYFKPEAKKRMDELIKNLRKAFEIRINGLEWMGAETKVKAQAKLAAFNPKIGYPDQWENYDGMEIIPTAFYQSVRNAAIWRYKDNISKLGKPVDRTRFGMTPPTVNAYYNATLNEIVFPAGILQFPFFHPKADDAVNYGGIGAVIGHEMSHGFDDQGSQFDADGTLRNWWTEKDRKDFDARTAQLAKQYDSYTVLDTIHVNGKFTLGENIGDLGGLNAAYEAFKLTDQFKNNVIIDGLTPTQRFYLAWAQVWRMNVLPETAAQLIITDPHSPGQYRTIGPIVNMDSWYSAFGVKEGDKLYIKPEDRIRIW